MNQNLQAIAQATSNEEYRPSMSYIKLTGTEAHATNGFILASMPCETTKPGLVSTFHIKKALKLDDIDIDARTITPSKWQTNAGHSFSIEEAPENVSYPPIEKVRKHKGDNTHLRLGMSVGVLETIVKMMKKADQEIIELEFSDNPRGSIYGKFGEIELTIMPAMVKE